MIGSLDVLTHADLRLFTEVPGVNDRYEDHHVLIYLLFKETIDGLRNGKFSIEDMTVISDLMLGYSCTDVIDELGPINPDAVSPRPGFQAVFDMTLASYLNKPLMMMA